MSELFHTRLNTLMDQYVHYVFDITLLFPKMEQYVIVSQLRRASLSVVLNYTEGYARKRKAVLRNFLEISYGSLKESRYLLDFSYKRKYISMQEYTDAIKLADEIGRIVWSTLKGME